MICRGDRLLHPVLRVRHLPRDCGRHDRLTEGGHGEERPDHQGVAEKALDQARRHPLPVRVHPGLRVGGPRHLPLRLPPG